MTDPKRRLITLRDEVRAGNLPRPLPFSGWESAYIIGAFNGSLDDAKALHESVLPRQGWEVIKTGEYPGMIPGSSAYKFAARVGYGTTFRGEDDNPARAWLLAILEALIAREGE